jgi:hypothetical protein
MKRHLIIFVSTAILFLGITLPVFADMISISGLYNTGVNDAGTVLTPGAIDTHYVLSSGSPLSSGQATIVPYTGTWVTPISGSNWIGPQTHAAWLSSDPAGDYSYKLSFNLTGLNPTTANIGGFWATDNNGVLSLNGHTISAMYGEKGYDHLTQFSWTGSYFKEGINTLEFKVNNWNGNPINGNPSGLLVSGLQGTAAPVPLPPSLMLIAPGLLGLVGLRKRINI